MVVVGSELMVGGEVMNYWTGLVGGGTHILRSPPTRCCPHAKPHHTLMLNPATCSCQTLPLTHAKPHHALMLNPQPWSISPRP